MLIDEDGNVKNSYSYNPWGDISEKSETIDNPFTYYGQIHDEETGLYYLRARYYDPKTKRFITEDPARDALNWYAYCGNNPVKFVDPLGLKAQGEVFGLGGGSYYDVLQVQVYLNSNGYRGINDDLLVEDGIFGKNTLHAVKRYQEDRGLVVDGLVGDKTWTSMGFEYSSVYNSVNKLKIDINNWDSNSDDYYDQNYKDKGRGSDSKKREAKMIDDALGKSRSEREQESKDLHNSKKGKRNDDNKSYGNLKLGDYWEEAALGAGITMTLYELLKIGITLYTGIPVY